jgi:hypothetical protein
MTLGSEPTQKECRAIGNHSSCGGQSDEFVGHERSPASLFFGYIDGKPVTPVCLTLKGTREQATDEVALTKQV